MKIEKPFEVTQRSNVGKIRRLWPYRTKNSLGTSSYDCVCGVRYTSNVIMSREFG
ncbi:Hypothetical predicted protein [Octopus vulgaris]|uniref:Uncharacterized protein n=1 Tax=Octopus vulgaris TaxID=6645 RepID=A0AA36EWQ2_OCTVU|nr:Hypothetical predicted protein [Octopus vulgaris]